MPRMAYVEFVSISNAHWPSKMNIIIIPILELRKLWWGEDGNPGSGSAGDELRLESSYVADPFPNCYVGSGGTGENGTGVIQDWRLGDRSELSQMCRHGVECPPGIINSSGQNLYSSRKRIHVERSVRLNVKDRRGSDGDHYWPHMLLPRGAAMTQCWLTVPGTKAQGEYYQFLWCFQGSQKSEFKCEVSWFQRLATGIILKMSMQVTLWELSKTCLSDGSGFQAMSHMLLGGGWGTDQALLQLWA